MDWSITPEEYMKLIFEFLDKEPSLIEIRLKIWILKGKHRVLLTNALHLWTCIHGKENIDIKYIESDTFIKRIITNKLTGITKTISQEIYYDSKWYWYSINKELTTVIRPGI
jgi:hypothetical protein